MEFSEWLKAWSAAIEAAQLHSKTDLPTEPEGIQADINTTGKHSAVLGDLVADCGNHLTKCRAQETLHLHGDPKFSGYTAAERRAEVEGRISHIARVLEILKATRRALGERHFALLNQRRYEETSMRMMPR